MLLMNLRKLIEQFLISKIKGDLLVEIVAGLTIKQLSPRVWDADSPYYLPELTAVMVSFADFYKSVSRRKAAMEQGLHNYLGIPSEVKIYLDNGAFYFLRREGETPRKEYEQFVERAKPDWYPIPQDYIPLPQMDETSLRSCFNRTMQTNHAYNYDGFVPVIHISRLLEEYTLAIVKNKELAAKPAIALGGIVPNLLKAPKALKPQEILSQLQHVREVFHDKKIHVFGIGGTATLHLAALLRIDSVDSSGWRNRAARGIIQLPGSGERMVTELGSWRGRSLSEREWITLENCQCPACRNYGIAGLTTDKSFGFYNRATHNLWVLLEEINWIDEKIKSGTYADAYVTHLDNTIYRPLIDKLVEKLA
jgi:7-cyano-7-deazaguanine tRNA-ribosyltransferase